MVLQYFLLSQFIIATNIRLVIAFGFYIEEKTDTIYRDVLTDRVALILHFPSYEPKIKTSMTLLEHNVKQLIRLCD